MQRPDSVRLRKSRSSIMSPDMALSISSALQTVTPSVKPPPAFVAAAAASQLVTDAHILVLQSTSESPLDHLSEPDNAIFSEGALFQINAFLDHLLYKFLATSRSPSLKSLRPAAETVLKGRLGRSAVAAADAELAELLGEEEDAEGQDTPEDGTPWDTELYFRRTRLRIMVYMRLGEMEDEDEEDHLAEFEDDNLDEHGRTTSNPDERGLVSWAAAIFLTSVLELVAEECIEVAGQAAFKRIQLKKTAAADALPDDLKQRITIVEADVDKAGIDSRLGRLWRTWRHKLRAPFHENARPGSAPRSPLTTRNASISTVQSDNAITPLSFARAQGAKEEPTSPSSVAPDAASVSGLTDVAELANRHGTLAEQPELDEEDRQHYARMLRATNRPVSLHNNSDARLNPFAGAIYSHDRESTTTQRPQTSPHPAAQAQQQAKAVDPPQDEQTLAPVEALVPAPAQTPEQAHAQPPEQEVIPDSVQNAPSAKDFADQHKEQVPEAEAAETPTDALPQPVLSKDVHEENFAAAPVEAERAAVETENATEQSPVPTDMTPIEPTSSHTEPGERYYEAQQRPSVDKSVQSSAPALSPMIGGGESYQNSSRTSYEEQDEVVQTASTAKAIPRALQTIVPATLYTAENAKPFKQSSKAASTKETKQPYPLDTSYTAAPVGYATSPTGYATAPTSYVTEPTTPASTSSAAANSPFAASYPKYNGQARRGTTESVTPPDVPTSEKKWYKHSKTPSLKNLRKASSESEEDEIAGKHFSSYIATQDTLKYTLTPRHLQDIEVGSPRTLRPIVDDNARNTGSASAASDAGTSVYDDHASDGVTYGTARVITPIRSYSQFPFASPPASPSVASTGSNRPYLLTTRRPAETNTKPLKKGFVPREARVITDSTRDFAEFLRSSGPSGSGPSTRPNTAARSIPRVQLSRRTSNDLGKPAERLQPALASHAEHDAIPPIPSMYQAREGLTSTRSANADLIEFLRGGPPGSSGTAPPRPSAGFGNGWETSTMQQVSPQFASPNGQTSSGAPSRGSSRAPRRDTNGYNTAPQPEAATNGRKQYRNKDPYALPSDDEIEREDYIMPVQAPRVTPAPVISNTDARLPPKNAARQESMIEFLKSEPPPSATKKGGKKFWKNL